MHPTLLVAENCCRGIENMPVRKAVQNSAKAPFSKSLQE
jgi:hypothetical protein